LTQNRKKIKIFNESSVRGGLYWDPVLAAITEEVARESAGFGLERKRQKLSLEGIF